jgi:hypothetical protein
MRGQARFEDGGPTSDPWNVHDGNWKAWISEIKQGWPYFRLPDDDATFLDELLSEDECPVDVAMERLKRVARILWSCAHAEHQTRPFEDEPSF